MPTGARRCRCSSCWPSASWRTTYAPERAEKETGVAAATIRRIAAELAHAAFKEEITLDIPWTDWTGRRHEKMIGRPVGMHAMRGISAHANGFHTCRILHVLQILLGSIDCPGGFRYKAPYPKLAPPFLKPRGKPGDVQPGKPLPGPQLGFPTGPEDLLVDAARHAAAHRQGLQLGRAVRPRTA